MTKKFSHDVGIITEDVTALAQDASVNITVPENVVKEDLIVQCIDNANKPYIDFDIVLTGTTLAFTNKNAAALTGQVKILVVA